MLAAKLMGAMAGGSEQLFVDDVFSTYLYTGNGSTQTITNGIDLAGKGGLVWIKSRSGVADHALFDTSRGVGNKLQSSTTAAQSFNSNSLTSFDSSGFVVEGGGWTGQTSVTYVSHTFRKSARFFDCGTFVGNGSNQVISHALGVSPGMIIVKRTDTGGVDWRVYHRSHSIPNETWMGLNTTAAASTSGGSNIWDATSTTFIASTFLGLSNSGGTYVWYAFAHDSTTDGIIQCGSVIADGSGVANVTLGWEPQFVLLKRTVAGPDWYIVDTMRGFDQSTSEKSLVPNSSGAELTDSYGHPTATGFSFNLNSSGAEAVYMAIRRPNKPPTTGTQVYNSVVTTDDSVKVSAGFPVDFGIRLGRNALGLNQAVYDRLRGAGSRLVTTATSAESTGGTGKLDYSDGWLCNLYGVGNSCSLAMFKRAVGVFDVVCYTGNGTYGPKSHGLGVVPELLIQKSRSNADDWYVLNGAVYLKLNTTAAGVAYASPVGTSTTFNPISDTASQTYVNYLFATKAGISKVGSYTGNGSSQTINCGFTTGARFLLIKRTDAAGDWYCWDSTRGIVAGNDPYLLLNSTAAEVTSTDYIDPETTGFQLSSTAPAAINASGGSFVYLAFA